MRTVKTVNAMEPRGSDVEIEQPDIVKGEAVENAIFYGGFHRESSEDMVSSKRQNLAMSLLITPRSMPMRTFYKTSILLPKTTTFILPRQSANPYLQVQVSTHTASAQFPHVRPRKQ